MFGDTENTGGNWSTVGLWDTSFDQPITDATITPDIVTASADKTAGGLDVWGGWFRDIVGGAAQYAIQKDAVQNRIVLKPTGQQYTPATPRQNNNLLFLAVIGGVILIATHKG